MDAAEPSLDNQSRILNTDDRLRVTDTTATPWRMIGQVRAWWGDRGYTGTGVLVGPDQVISAAHCVYRAELGGWADRATFTPARADNSQPYGSAGVIRYALPRGYTQQQNEAQDIVLVTLDQPLGDNTGWLDVIGQSQDSYDLARAVLYSAGYPADKPDGMYSESGSMLAATNGSENVWQIDLDATFGQSGSPIWIDAAPYGGPLLVAVIVAELDSGRANLATPVTAELLDQLRANETPNTSIAQATDGNGDVAVGEPGADSPLTAAPIAACGAGIAPMTVIAIAGIMGLRRRGLRPRPS